MTQAKFEHRGDSVRVEITGHAGDGKICAGISALVCASLMALEGLGHRPDVESLGDGEAIFTAETPGAREVTVIDVLQVGLLAMQRQWPDHVGVTLISLDVIE